jgi:hypothetical protein
MTIRQVLIRRYWFAMCGLAVVLALGLVWHATEQTHNFRSGVLYVLGLSLVATVAFGFRCPRCHAAAAAVASFILYGALVGRASLVVSRDA